MNPDYRFHGRSMTFITAPDATQAERHVARVASEAARRRGVTGHCHESGDVPPTDLAVFLGVGETHPHVVEELSRRDRFAPSSPLTRGAQSSRIVSCVNQSADAVAIWGADIEGLWVAVGRFLRGLRWKDGAFSSAGWDDEFRPAFELRGEVMSSHFTANTFFQWSPRQWFEYMDEMALWGMNLFITIPIHMADWDGISPWSDPPRWVSEERRKEWDTHWETHCAVSQRVHEMGLRYGLWIPANDVPPMMAEADWNRGGGKYVCPSVPEARRAIQYTRSRVIQGLPHVDYWFVPSSDNGGCPCDDCQPWVDTYLSLAEEQFRELAKWHPGAKVILSNQALTHEENKKLCARLAEPGTEWIEGVAYAPGSNETYIQARETEEYDWIDWYQFDAEHRSLKELSRTMPPSKKLFLYPDITHLTRSQYPVWDVDPLVAWTYHRDTVFFRPRGYADVFRRSAPHADGSFPYSEGIYDDLNQVVWLALSCEPGRTHDDILSEYWRWHAGEDAVFPAVCATHQLEDSWRGDITANAQVETAVLETEKAVRLARGTGWRLDLLRMRALLDEWLKNRLRAAKLLESGIIAMLRDDATESGVLRAIESLDSAIRSLPEASDEVLRLGESLLRAGPRMPVGRVRHVTGNLAWMKATLKKALVDPSVRSALVADVIDYERGVYYVDCGNPVRDTFCVHGRRYTCLDERSYQTPFSEAPEIRPSQNSLVMTCGEDDGIVYRFPDLHPDRKYVVRLTYFLPTLFTYRETRSQKLEANGVEVHGPLILPRKHPETFEFALPPGSYSAGETTLRFRKAEGGVTTVVSEIWIRECE
ncbi:MAG TPA: hypothetical protein PLM66_11255 [Candidatus Latescibacteria bacterium]|nr:hypothetical protein [Candidatus Latescibacterota bacterium]